MLNDKFFKKNLNLKNLSKQKEKNNKNNELIYKKKKIKEGKIKKKIKLKNYLKNNNKKNENQI
jgi:hypothetical protein